MTTSTSKHTSIDKSPEKEKEKEKEVIPNKSPISFDLTQNILGELKFDYDGVEDLKKIKSNIMVFELCKIMDLMEELHEALQPIRFLEDVVVGNSKTTQK